MNRLIDFEKVAEQIKKHEGLSLTVYNDTEGIATVGYGHNMQKNLPSYIKVVDNRINKQHAEEIFQIDFIEAVVMARQLIPRFDEFSGEQKGVFINMAFNLGTRLIYFARMREACQDMNYVKIAIEMLDSKWARQVGRRAIELAEIIKKG